MTKKRSNVEEIEAAMGHFKRRQLELTQAQLDDSTIREMLRPKALLEKDPRGFAVLRALTKYGPIPGPVMQKILGVSMSAFASEGIMASMIRDDLVETVKSIFNGHRCNIFTITSKGRAALKSCKK